MIAINLLNWREKRKLIQNNRFFFMIGVVVAACVALILIVHVFIDSKVSELQANVAYLSGEISAVQKKIEQIKDLQQQKDLLLSRRAVVEKLQASRSFEVKIFDNISRVMPGTVVLNELTRKEEMLTLSGYADSNTSVSTLLKNIARLRWVKDAKLTELKNVEEQQQTAIPGSENIKTNRPIVQRSRVEFSIQVTMDPEGGMVK